jgi:hypothetical protein
MPIPIRANRLFLRRKAVAFGCERSKFIAKSVALLCNRLRFGESVGFFRCVTITICAGGCERDAQVVAFPRCAVRPCDDFGLFKCVAVAFGRDRLQLIFKIGDFGQSRRQVAVGI